MCITTNIKQYYVENNVFFLCLLFLISEVLQLILFAWAMILHGNTLRIMSTAFGGYKCNYNTHLPLAFVSLISWYRQHLQGEGGFVMLKPFGARATPVPQMLSNPSLIMQAHFFGGWATKQPLSSRSPSYQLSHLTPFLCRPVFEVTTRHNADRNLPNSSGSTNGSH